MDPFLAGMEIMMIAGELMDVSEERTLNQFMCPILPRRVQGKGRRKSDLRGGVSRLSKTKLSKGARFAFGRVWLESLKEPRREKNERDPGMR